MAHKCFEAKAVLGVTLDPAADVKRSTVSL